MRLLFSYGTLQQDDVQRSTFGRLLEGAADEIVGFEPGHVRIEDPAVAATLGMTHHANAVFTGAHRSRVRGMAFEVTDAELAMVDVYEAPYSYRRIKALLASGREAWVYVHAPGSTSGPAAG